MADDPSSATFHWADYLVLGLFLALNVIIGLVIGVLDRKKATSKQFFTGGGDMHWIPVAFSKQASFLSAIYILSTPTEIYYFGTTYVFLGISYLIAIPIAGYMFMPTFYKLKLISVYEYLERRFNRTVRSAGALTFCLMVILYMSVVLYTPAIALAQVTGLSVNISIVVCGLVCTAYTVIGGMKATIWNDFIQMLVVLVGLLLVICLGVEKQGGIDKVWAINDEGGRLIFDSFNPDPTIRTTFWTQVVGGTFVTLTLSGATQTNIQKFLSIKTFNNALKSMWFSVFTSVLFLVLVTVVGLVMYAFYAGCDPLISVPPKIEKSDQMVPLFIMDIMGHLPGLPGLFIASSFSAALSSISGSVNALSAVTLLDFIRPIYLHFKKVNITEKTSAILSRCLALFFGVVTILMGFAAQYLGDLALQVALSIFGFVGGPVTALLTVGLFLPFVNSWGALAGLLSSLIICSWIAVGSILAKNPTPILPLSTDTCYPIDYFNGTMTTAYTNGATYTTGEELLGSPGSDILWVYKLSHMYYGLIAMIITFIVSIVVSLITGVAKDTDPRLTFQWGNECCCYCPIKCRNCLRCGTKEIDEDTECSDEEIVKKAVDSVGSDNFIMSYNDSDDKNYNDKTTTTIINDNPVVVANGTTTIHSPDEKSVTQNGVHRGPILVEGSQVEPTETSKSDQKSPIDLEGSQVEPIETSKSDRKSPIDLEGSQAGAALSDDFSTSF